MTVILLSFLFISLFTISTPFTLSSASSINHSKIFRPSPFLSLQRISSNKKHFLLFSSNDDETDLMTEFLAESASRISSSSPSRLSTHERRSLEYISPSSIGGWKPERGPSFLIPPDGVVQYILTVFMTEQEDDGDEEDYSSSEETIQQAFIFTACIDYSIHGDTHIRKSWMTQRDINLSQFENELKIHYQSLITCTGYQFIDPPVFHPCDRLCYVDVWVEGNLDKKEKYRFELERPKDAVTHHDCWMIYKVEKIVESGGIYR